jgi:transcriptional regulator with XRE-family HTH domain
MLKVGEQLRKIREGKNYTQEELSLEAGFITSQVGRTERGEINTSISHIAAYAKVLGVHPREIFDVPFPVSKKTRGH